jgi:hypothetical protein
LSFDFRGLSFRSGIAKLKLIEHLKKPSYQIEDQAKSERD